MKDNIKQVKMCFDFKVDNPSEVEYLREFVFPYLCAVSHLKFDSLKEFISMPTFSADMLLSGRFELDELKMLQRDIADMTLEEVIDLLRFDLDMRTFDSSTGEHDSLFRLKNCGNELNYPVYVAICKVIDFLERNLFWKEEMVKYD